MPYPTMKDSGMPWLGEVPGHWDLERGKSLFTKVERPVRETDEVVTCFRDGAVTLRKKRRIQGFTESLKEIEYQGIRAGDLVIHAMDAFAGAVGVADSDGKGTPVYAVCEPKPNADAHYHAFVIREMARSQWIPALATGIRERSTDFRFGTYASQRVLGPTLPRASRHRAVFGSCGPASAAVGAGEAEADRAAHGAEADHRPPRRHPRSRPRRAPEGLRRRVAGRGSGALAGGHRRKTGFIILNPLPPPVRDTKQ
ncbi:hypothetical protein NKDENANG_01718 [Candidatus Entotheonellaceae bacterium PAL068K]